jgi:uncharacterized alkaline shock family protein YloU
MTVSTEPNDHYMLAEVTEDGVHGTISVSPNVLVDIIELATRGTDGFVRFVSPGHGRSRWLPVSDEEQTNSREGSWYSRSGIRVRLEDGAIDADLSVEARHGVNVPALGDELKRRIDEAIDRMLGLRTGTISVHVRAIADAGNGSGG